MMFLPAATVSIVSSPMPAATPAYQASIVNSGSTNTRGYIVQLSRSGTVRVDAQDGRGLRTVDVNPDLIKKFFAILDSSAPLAKLPQTSCARSKSFGYSINVSYAGAQTPDLRCPVNQQESDLASISAQIVTAAHLSDRAPRHAP
jgi:hypothetical protein